MLFRSAVDQRLDGLPVVRDRRRCQHQPHAEAPGDLDGLQRAFARRESAEEQQVVLRLRAEGEGIRRLVAALALPALLGLVPFALSAQTPTTTEAAYIWRAELVSVDTAAKAVTLKAPVEAPVAGYAGSFKPGDRLMLTWTANGGQPESGPVLYLEPYGSPKAAIAP